MHSKSQERVFCRHGKILSKAGVSRNPCSQFTGETERRKGEQPELQGGRHTYVSTVQGQSTEDGKHLEVVLVRLGEGTATDLVHHLHHADHAAAAHYGHAQNVPCGVARVQVHFPVGAEGRASVTGVKGRGTGTKSTSCLKSQHSFHSLCVVCWNGTEASRQCKSESVLLKHFHNHPSLFDLVYYGFLLETPGSQRQDH